MGDKADYYIMTNFMLWVVRRRALRRLRLN
jgi:hypothetical protein